MARANARTKPDDIERAKRQQMALELRREGHTFADIAEALEVTKSTAHRYVTEAVAEFKRDGAELLIDLELSRLDALVAILWPLAKQGDLGAIDRLLRIMQQRGKYYAIEQYAVNKLATNTKSLSDVDAWAAAMLGRTEPDKTAAAAMSDDDITAFVAAELAAAAEAGDE